jgi:hypothetical protein
MIWNFSFLKFNTYKIMHGNVDEFVLFILFYNVHCILKACYGHLSMLAQDLPCVTQMSTSSNECNIL